MSIDRCGPLLAFSSLDETALGERLAADKVVTSSRDGNLRAGFHLYNNEMHVERLVSGLQRHRTLLIG